MLFVNKGKILITMSTIILMLLSFCLTMVDILQGDAIVAVLKNTAHPLCYTIGMLYMVRIAKYRKAENAIRVLFVVIACGFGMHVFLNLLFNLTSAGANLGRNTLDIWSQEIFSATGQASLFVTCIGVAIAIFFSSYSYKYKIIAIVMSIIAFLYNLQLACRTPIVMAAIVMMIAIFYMIKSTDVRKNKIIMAMFFLLLLLIGAIIFYNINLFDIQTRLEQSNLFMRIFHSEELQSSEGRIELRMHYLHEIWQYPFGGSHLINKYGYAHDLFFDTWDKAGIIAFISVLTYIATTLFRLYKVLKNHILSFDCKQLILCVYCAFYLEFLVEPILYGMPWLFATFCIIDGSVMTLLNLTKKSMNN